MPTYRAQIVIPHTNGIVADAITNTLHFIDFVPQPLADLADDVTPLIQTLYQQIYAGGQRAGNYMAWNLAEVNWYDLSQPTPRVPYTLPLPLTITSAATFVAPESSAVLSFQAPRVPGVPQARRRGRIYLGGLGNGFITSSAPGTSPYVTTAVVDAIGTAAEVFRNAVGATSARWAVWSPTDQAAYIITNGWVDNAIDTQRRRGTPATARSLWP